MIKFRTLVIFVFRLQKLENIKGTSKKEVTTFYAMPIISIKTYLKFIYPFEDINDQFNSSD